MYRLFKVHHKAKHTLWLTVAICLSVSLCGCLPLSTTYYRGSAPGAERASEGCDTVAGPRPDIQFSNEGLVVRIGVDQGSGTSTTGSYYVALTVTVPKDKTAVFESDKLELRTDIASESRELSFQTFRGTSPTETMTGTYMIRAYMYGLTREATPDLFYVQVPAIRMGSTEIEYPVITFTKTTGAGIYALCG